jgi:GNAT superfamily N-acetyltransferase
LPAGFALVVTITPQDVGTRVSVRRRLADGTMTDAVGMLLRWSDGTLAVARKDGSVTEIAEETLLAGKRVPPAPLRALGNADGARELQRIAADGWPAAECAELGGWRLRATAGWTLRANSVLPLTDPGVPLEAAMAFVDEWYAHRGLPVVFSVPSTASEVDEALVRRGFTVPRAAQILVLTAPAIAVPEPVAPAGLAPAELLPAPEPGWLGCYRARGEVIPPVGLSVLTGPAQVVFAQVRAKGSAGEVLAIGRATVAEGWVGLSAVETAPAARRRGLARHVVCALVAYGRQLGARNVFLQVATDNEAALTLYRELGLTLHHTYHYRVAPGSGATR